VRGASRWDLCHDVGTKGHLRRSRGADGDRVTPFLDVSDVVVVMSLGHLLGADGRNWYDFWSGFGADLGQIALVGAAIGLYRKHNCHVHRCWRIAKQQVEGTQWMVCHKHHPDGKPTGDDMDRLAADRRHREAQASSLTLVDPPSAERTP
jgi:hypothetical protein